MIFSLLLTFAFAKDCLDSMASLEKAKVKSVWEETTMDDGKPLVISIFAQDGRLKYTAVKAGETWLNGDVCIRPDGKHMRLENTVATKNVPYIARKLLPKSQEGKIENDHVHLGGVAWRGTFKGR